MVRKRVRLTDENDPLTPTDKVLEGLASLSRSRNDTLTSQEVEKSESQLVEDVELEEISEPSSRKSKSQKVDKLSSQEADKLILKKATFRLSEEVLEALDQLHLKLQLNMGKANAPYKEVMVEEAIANFLADFERMQEKKTKALTVRQNQR